MYVYHILNIPLNITCYSIIFFFLCVMRPKAGFKMLYNYHEIIKYLIFDLLLLNFGILKQNTELKVFVFEVKYSKVNHYYYHYYLVPKWLTVLYNYLSYGWFGCYFSPSVDDSSKQFFKTARCFLNCCIIYLKFRLVVWSKFVNCLHVSLNLINRS